MCKSSKVKRLLSLVLCTAILLALCAGCGSSSTETEETTTSESAQTEEAASDTEETAEAEEAASDTEETAEAEEAETETVDKEESAEETEQTEQEASEDTDSEAAEQTEAEEETEQTTSTELPICEETETISYWFEMSPMVASYLETMNDNITYQYLEELTNVHVDFWAVSDETSQNFNLMITSGDWADIMVWGSNYYSGGAIKAVEDGVFMELTDVIAEYMPNYAALIEDPDIYPQVIMNDGNIGEIFPINWGTDKPGTGPIVRKDWLDDLGIDASSIQTYDDYHDMLLAFKTEKGATQALYLGPYGVPSGNYLVAGYGVAAYCDPSSDTGPYYQQDGVVKCGLIESGFCCFRNIFGRGFF